MFINVLALDVSDIVNKVFVGISDQSNQYILLNFTLSSEA